jgi:hypothetical protein
MADVIDLEAAPATVAEGLAEFCTIAGRSGSNTIYHCIACKTLYKGKGDAKQWTLTCAPMRALAHVARIPGKGVRACDGKYTPDQKAAAKQLWNANQEVVARKKRRSEDGEQTVVLQGQTPLIWAPRRRIPRSGPWPQPQLVVVAMDRRHLGPWLLRGRLPSRWQPERERLPPSKLPPPRAPGGPSTPMSGYKTNCTLGT